MPEDELRLRKKQEYSGGDEGLIGQQRVMFIGKSVMDVNKGMARRRRHWLLAIHNGKKKNISSIATEAP